MKIITLIILLFHINGNAVACCWDSQFQKLILLWFGEVNEEVMMSGSVYIDIKIKDVRINNILLAPVFFYDNDNVQPKYCWKFYINTKLYDYTSNPEKYVATGTFIQNNFITQWLAIKILQATSLFEMKKFGTRILMSYSLPSENATIWELNEIRYRYSPKAPKKHQP